ncbi:MAG: hypothetical protein O7F12_16155 [Nitrospirae bacterium]|nr:hypothetical protein [Nitrospirota bacterium]
MYVIKLAPAERGINILISNKLKQMGYLANTGIETPSDVDVVVTYMDKMNKLGLKATTGPITTIPKNLDIVVTYVDH